MRVLTYLRIHWVQPTEYKEKKDEKEINVTCKNSQSTSMRTYAVVILNPYFLLFFLSLTILCNNDMNHSGCGLFD